MKRSCCWHFSMALRSDVALTEAMRKKTMLHTPVAQHFSPVAYSRAKLRHLANLLTLDDHGAVVHSDACKTCYQNTGRAGTCFDLARARSIDHAWAIDATALQQCMSTHCILSRHVCRLYIARYCLHGITVQIARMNALQLDQWSRHRVPLASRHWVPLAHSCNAGSA